MRPRCVALRRVFVALGLLALAACRREPVATTQRPDPGALPKAPAKPLAANVKDCGTELNSQGQGYRADARECFWKAYVAGTPAHLTVTVHTVEGDPMRYDMDVLSKHAIDVVLDSRDRFGAQGMQRWRCAMLEKEPTGQADSSRFSLRLQQCQSASRPDQEQDKPGAPAGDPVQELTIP